MKRAKYIKALIISGIAGMVASAVLFIIASNYDISSNNFYPLFITGMIIFLISLGLLIWVILPEINIARIKKSERVESESKTSITDTTDITK